MSFTDRIEALKGTGRRRAIDKVEELRDENRRLLARVVGVDDAFALLHQELADTRSKQAETEEIVVKQLASIEDLRAENDQLHTDLAALKARFAKELADEANANAIDVPQAVRPIDGPEDEATAPIDVRPLWAARDAGLLSNADTQPIPTA